MSPRIAPTGTARCDCGRLFELKIGDELWIAPSQRKSWGSGVLAETPARVVGWPRPRDGSTRYVRVSFLGWKTAMTMAVAWFCETAQHKAWEAKP